MQLWFERVPGPGRVPVLLVADADMSGVAWPDALVAGLAAHHPVIRYDHRDTGASTGGEKPYGVVDLAADAVAVLDACAERHAHVVGLGLGGLLTQVLLLDHPGRVASATLVATGPLPGAGVPPVPGPDLALRRMWAELDDPRDAGGELAWRVALRRVLHGTGLPFDEAACRVLEERVIAHSGSWEPAGAHLGLDGSEPARGAELAGVTVPTLVVEAPEDPAYPPPSSAVLAGLLGGRLLTVPGMGHAVTDATAPVVVAAVLGLARRTAEAP